MKMHAYINGGRRPDLEKLTPAMWSMLFDVRDLRKTMAALNLAVGLLDDQEYELWRACCAVHSATFCATNNRTNSLHGMRAGGGATSTRVALRKKAKANDQAQAQPPTWMPERNQEKQNE